MRIFLERNSEDELVRHSCSCIKWRVFCEWTNLAGARGVQG